MPEVTAHLADGTTLHFPDGTSDAVVAKAVKSSMAPPVDPETERIKKVQALKYPTSAERGGKLGAAIQEGPLQGFADEGRRNTGALFNAITDTAPGTKTGMDDPAVSFIAGAQPGNAFSGIPNAIETMAAPAAQTGTLADALKAGPLVGPIVGAGENLLSKVRRYRAGGDIPYIEQQIKPAGAERQAATIKIAPQMAEDPQLLAAKGARFDQQVFDKFKAAEAELKAAGQSVPQGTMIPKKGLMDDLLDTIDKQSSFESNPEVVSNSAAHKILGDWYNKLDKLPDQIPFEELRDFRQKLDRDIMTHGGWKETASSADRAEMQANRDVVNTIRKHLKGINARLDTADAAYGPAADAVSASGLDWESGRRLAGVGKPPKPGLIRKALPVIGAAGLGVAAANGRKILGALGAE